MPRLPSASGDKNQWAPILLEWLRVHGNEDGSLKPGALGSLVPALMPVASRAAPSYAGVAGNLSDGIVTSGTARYQHVAIQTCHGIVLAFSNVYNNAGTETDGVNDITVKASVESPSTRMFPVTFNGQRSVVVNPGCTVFSDPVAVALTKGTVFYTRTFVSVASAGQKWPDGCDTLNAGNTEGHTYGAPGTDLTPVGSAAVTAVGSVRAFGPSAILGYQKTRANVPVIGIVGDSIAAGSGDTSTFTDWGYIKRALNNNYPFQSVAYPSETVDGWMQQSGATRFRRAMLLERVGVTHFICQLGVNSISNPSVQANILQVWQYLASFGVPVYQSTITPNTTSTDSWATVVNQTPANAANETRRVALNAYIRSVPSPLTGIFEIADLAESARDSGRWNPSYTSDGIHPNATGAAALAVGITPAIFGNAAT